MRKLKVGNIWYFFECVCSIGSLGIEAEEDGVHNITVTSSTFTGTQNGVRIKSWGRPSNGFATNVHFQHIIMDNVKNPIIIDQNYCPHLKDCPGQVYFLINLIHVNFFLIIFKLKFD